MVDPRRQVTQEHLNAGEWTTAGQGFTAISYTATVAGTAVNGERVNQSSPWTAILATHATIAVGELSKFEGFSFGCVHGGICAWDTAEMVGMWNGYRSSSS